MPKLLPKLTLSACLVLFPVLVQAESTVHVWDFGDEVHVTEIHRPADGTVWIEGRIFTSEGLVYHAVDIYGPEGEWIGGELFEDLITPPLFFPRLPAPLPVIIPYRDDE